MTDNQLLVPDVTPAATSSQNETASPVLAFFGHDARESTIKKRIAAFQAHGWTVRGFTFARDRFEEPDAASEAPFWTNTELGLTQDRNYRRRLTALARAIPKILRERNAIRAAEVIYARNIDMMALAVAAKQVSRSRAKLVYEVLDVQRLLLDPGAAGATMRAAERRLLAHADLLVVSAPDFVERYFKPIQGYSGPFHLLENKIAPAQLREDPQAWRRGSRTPPVHGTWIIGWSGVLRCARSLELLERISARLGNQVRVIMRGRLSEEDLPREIFAAVLQSRPNMSFEGPYRSPSDLAAMYGGVHFNWSIDYTDAGSNSDWLLPNRVYEGGFFGVPAFARAETATGRFVDEHALGHALPEPLEEAVCDLLGRLTPTEYAASRRELLDRPVSLFVDDGQVASLLSRFAVLERSV
jgi:succinoglycan biosynthesis protein ExoL